ncbi:MAG: hypothetical protein KAS88_00780 [Deltaproteobacteria bacterium]|nr:hypothetical protein [Deltaproteobacteria bacterium]
MKDLLTYTALTIIYLSIKSTLAPNLPMPDMLILIAFHIATRRPSAVGALLVFSMGYMEEVFTGGVIGVSSFSMGVIYIGAYLVAHKADFAETKINAASAVVVTLLKAVIALILLRLVGVEAHIFPHIIPVALLTGLFAPLFTAVFERIDALLYGHPDKEYL